MAEAACDATRSPPSPGTSTADDPTVQRQVGLMRTGCGWPSGRLDGALADGRRRPGAVDGHRGRGDGGEAGDRLAGIEVCDLALEVGGGAAFYRTSPIEQCYRDVRAVKFHPFGPEETLVHAGRVALGLPGRRALIS